MHPAVRAARIGIATLSTRASRALPSVVTFPFELFAKVTRSRILGATRSSTMKKPQPQADPQSHWREIAELEVLHLCSAEERAALDAAVAAGTPEAIEARQQAARLSGALALGAPGAAPPAGLREQVLAKIAAAKSAAGPRVQIWKEWQSAGAGVSRIVRGEGAEWENIDIEGIQVRRLHVDRDANSVTMLVRMSPGTAYPPHRHGGMEECYVLEGDIHVGDAEMRAGDYQICERDSRHPVQSTRGGCLLLIRSSLTDEMTSL